jgi:hypothetical protein
MRYIQETFSQEKQHAILEILKGVWLVLQKNDKVSGHEITSIIN